MQKEDDLVFHNKFQTNFEMKQTKHHTFKSCFWRVFGIYCSVSCIKMMICYSHLKATLFDESYHFLDPHIVFVHKV